MTRVLHVLDHSLPMHSGYSFRTRAILKAQEALGLDVRGITGQRHSASGPHCEVVDGLTFHRTRGTAGGPPVWREWREIKRLAESYLQSPVTVEVARPNATASTVEQHFYSVSDDDKRAAVRQLLRQRELSQAFVFVNSKLGAARLARAFERDGLKTAALHGDKSQDERLKSLDAFKRGEVDLLVATDVAARGLDIADLPAVFNFDVPFNAEDYVHRIGRTGRAGASGVAVTLVTDRKSVV